ncbi:caspase family protein [Almyronema epifaneia]|uniref:Caspase domain-containing protein n=1 Tax=Almyronema epifaneia S1 TaxID=2991925 RepID=A0ABW6IH38_9CYAN
MTNKALLVGVDKTGVWLPSNPLGAATETIQALREVITSEKGPFQTTEVETLINPDAQQTRQAIARLCTNAEVDDLRLLYFFGAGLMEAETRKVYLAAANTDPHYLQTTAVSADFLKGSLDSSLSQRQMVILDCGWYGTLSENSSILGSVNLAHLASEHRVVLTCGGQSLTMTAKGPLPLYTQILIEGIRTELADINGDSAISAAELHHYIYREIHETDLEIYPFLYALGNSAQLTLMQLPTYAPEQEYRRSVEEYIAADYGTLTPQSRKVLDFLRQNLDLPTQVAEAIEAQVYLPHQEKRQKLDQYQQVYLEAIQLENPPRQIIRRRLRSLQRRLELTDDEIRFVEEQAQLNREPAVLAAETESRDREIEVLGGKRAIAALSEHPIDRETVA